MSVYVVRAEFGRYAHQFVHGGYVAIGWIGKTSLDHITQREELYPLYRTAHPEDTSKVVIGQQVGQIARFLLEIVGGDYVITPDADTDWLHYGKIGGGGSYSYVPGSPDGCPFPHRRKVEWSKKRIRRNDLSVPFQNTIRSSLTVYQVSQEEEFLRVIGEQQAATTAQAAPPAAFDSHQIVLEQLLQLDAKEFELLVTHLLAAIGFEAQHTGRPNDKGVDATGELDVSGLARIKLFVQVKRWGTSNRISARDVRSLRQAIPHNSQGAFITTASFQAEAQDVAQEDGFPRIGLINGHQLVDLLSEHWEDLPAEFREKIGLRRGLVRA